MEKGFYHPHMGYWQTTGTPTDDILTSYPEGTVEIPLKPGPGFEFNGTEWVLDSSYIEVVRSQVQEAINTWRDAQEASAIIFQHAGHNWDGGLATRMRLQPVVSLSELPDGFFWTDADNVDIPMTLAELQALNAAHESAITLRGWQIHQRQRQMKQEIQELTTVPELESYSVGWS